MVSLGTFPKPRGGCSQRKRWLNHVAWFMMPKPSHPSPLERLNCCVVQAEVVPYWRENLAKFGKLWVGRQPLSRQPLCCRCQCTLGGEEGQVWELRCGRSLHLCPCIDTYSDQEHGPFFCRCPSTAESFLMLQPSTWAEKLGCPRNSWHTSCSLLHLLSPLPHEAEKSRLF